MGRGGHLKKRKSKKGPRKLENSEKGGKKTPQEEKYMMRRHGENRALSLQGKKPVRRPDGISKTVRRRTLKKTGRKRNFSHVFKQNKIDRQNEGWTNYLCMARHRGCEKGYKDGLGTAFWLICTKIKHRNDGGNI